MLVLHQEALCIGEGYVVDHFIHFHCVIKLITKKLDMMQIYFPENKQWWLLITPSLGCLLLIQRMFVVYLGYNFSTVDSGTAQLFKKLDIGFLDTEDYLGISSLNLIVYFFLTTQMFFYDKFTEGGAKQKNSSYLSCRITFTRSIYVSRVSPRSSFVVWIHCYPYLKGSFESENLMHFHPMLLSRVQSNIFRHSFLKITFFPHFRLGSNLFSHRFCLHLAGINTPLFSQNFIKSG